MKVYSKIIHKIVFTLQVEFIFISLKKYITFFTKFIPLHTTYSTQNTRTIKRDNVYFKVLLSDYMQWYLYVDLPDLSWKKATEYIRENSSIIDVGANCGAFTLKLAQKAYEQKVSNFKIYSFEPNPLVYTSFNNNLKLNLQLIDYVSSFQLGLGNKEGFFDMGFSISNTGGGKIGNSLSANSVQIQLTTLDKFVAKENIQNITFIKIDVEGFEPFVIEGGNETIKKFLPCIYIEITDKWFRELNSSQHTVLNYFRGLLYTLYVEVENEFIKMEDLKIPLDTIYQYNLLALPINTKQ